MSHSELPTWREAEGLARVLGDLVDTTVGPAERDGVFLSHVSELFGASVGCLIRGECTPSGGQPVRFTSLHDWGLGDAERALMQAYAAENGQDDPLIAPGLKVLRGQPVQRTMAWLRDQLVPEDEFRRHPHYEMCQAIRGVDRLVSVVRLGERRVMCLSLARPATDRRFRERERRMLALALTHAARTLGSNPLPLGGLLRGSDGTLRDLKGRAPTLEDAFGLSPREVEVAAQRCARRIDTHRRRRADLDHDGLVIGGLDRRDRGEPP